MRREPFWGLSTGLGLVNGLGAAFSSCDVGHFVEAVSSSVGLKVIFSGQFE